MQIIVYVWEWGTAMRRQMQTAKSETGLSAAISGEVTDCTKIVKDLTLDVVCFSWMGHCSIFPGFVSYFAPGLSEKFTGNCIMWYTMVDLITTPWFLQPFHSKFGDSLWFCFTKVPIWPFHLITRRCLRISLGLGLISKYGRRSAWNEDDHTDHTACDVTGCIYQWIGLGENLQETIFNGKKPWFPVIFPLNQSNEFRFSRTF